MRPKRPFTYKAAAMLAGWLAAQPLALAQTPSREAAWKEIQAMEASDQRLRPQLQGMAQQGKASTPEFRALAQEQQRLDQQNMARLDELLRTHGWPRGVGAAAVAAAAALVIQHAELPHQQRWLPEMREAVKHGELAPIPLAMLEDRVLLRQGQPQRYGSQVVHDGRGRLYVHPIADAAGVDERRRTIGLGPLAAYAARMGASYEPLRPGPTKLAPGLCPDMPNPAIPNLPDGDYRAVAHFWLRGDGRIDGVQVTGANRLIPIVERNVRSFRCLATGDDRQIEMDFQVTIS